MATNTRSQQNRSQSRSDLTGSATQEDGNVSRPVPVNSGTAAPLSVPMFTPIAAPRIVSFDLASINSFLQLRDEYINTIRERRETHQENVHATSVKSCIPLSKLEGLATYIMGKDVDEVTDADILGYFDKVRGRVATSNTDDIDAMIRQKVVMNMSIRHAEDRVLAYFSGFDKLIKDHGLTNAFDKTDRRKSKYKCRHLIDGLRPDTLKTVVERAIRYGDEGDAEVDPKKLFALVLRSATEQEKFYRLYYKPGRNATAAVTSNQKKSPATSDKSFGKQPLVGRTQISDDSKDIPTQTMLKFKDKPAPVGGCLICKGSHWVQICPTSSVKQRREAFEKFRADRQKSDGATNIANRYSKKNCMDLSSTTDATPADGPAQTMDLTLNDLVTVKCQLDNGSSHTTIDRRMLRRLQASHHVLYKEFSQPLRGQQALANSFTTFIGSAILDLTIRSPIVGAASITLRRRECLVTLNDLSDGIALVGKPELFSMSIDPDHLFTNMLARMGNHTIVDSVATGEVDASSTIVGTQPHLKRIALPSPAANTGEEPGEDYFVDIGPHEESQAEIAIRKMVDRAIENGCPEDQRDRLLNDMKKRDMWRLRLGRDPPAKVTAMKITLKPGAAPFRAKSRRYAESHQIFMREHTKQLEGNDLVFRNPHSRYASACHVVSKKDVEHRGHRLTVDTKEVNCRTERVAWPMPHIDVVINYLRFAKIFILLDAFKGYWQFPLHPDSWEICSFQTHEAVFTPRRIIQGLADAVFAFQAGMQEILGDLLYSCALLWVDDILGYAKDFADWLKVLNKLLDHLDQHGVKLNPDRCHLFLREVKWCGRVISDSGVKFDDEFVGALRALPRPRTAADLQQFLCAANWIRSSIPRFSERFSPLQELLLHASRSISSLKRNQLQKIALDDIGWSTDHDTCFDDAKEALSTLLTMAHVNDDHVLCMFPDASKSFWAVILTQIPQEDLKKPFNAQRHEPIACLSGAFKGSQLNWAIIEKEGYPIVEGVHRLKPFLIGRTFHLFTDHRNLVYIFDPESRSPPASRTSGDRLERWQVQLRSYHFNIEHIAGNDNVWADILTRWGSASPDGTPAVVVSSIKKLSHVPFAMYKIADDFVWPTQDSIVDAQRRFIHDNELDDSSASIDVDGQKLTKDPGQQTWRTSAGKIWIADTGLITRILVVAHLGLSGHLTVTASINLITNLFWWAGDMKEDITNFISQCLHCLRTKDSVVPRPFGHAIHASEPNKVLHYDFLFISKRRRGCGHQFEYILVLKDDFSGFVELVACENADHFAVASALVDWFKRFGIVYQHVSDQGSHFKNRVIDELLTRLHVSHHFTTAYTPWANGTVEVVNHHVLTVLKSLSSEFNLTFADNWPYILPLVNMVLNHRVRPRISYAPITIFTGLQPTSLISTIFLPHVDKVVDVPVSAERMRQLTTELTASLDNIHKDVHGNVGHQRNLKRRSRLKDRRTLAINFEIGDYVLVANNLRRLPRKTLANWYGPCQIIDTVNDHIFKVKDLLSDDVSDIHAQRLRFYNDSSLEITSALLNNIATTSESYEVEKILDVRRNPSHGEAEVLIHWKGFDTADDSWEPLSTMLEDIPVIVKSFLQARAEHNPTARDLLATCD